MRQLTAALFSLLILGMAGAASALPFTVAPDPIAWAGGGSSGTVDFVGYTDGTPAGGTDLQGSTGVTDAVLIFQISVDSGSAAAVSIGVPLPPTFPTAGGTQAGTGDVAVASVSGFSDRTFTFASAVGAGQTSDNFYISFAALTDGSQGAVTIDVGPLITVPIVLTEVPEPGTAGLLGLGLLAVAAVRRRA
ncbi:MAG: PEP-CTERM sorting domain-containing protein [Proteobacteria bacterium]|nr:PEP-CTERM sorting domain-containing protein [Pseudomonadota bacterium]